MDSSHTFITLHSDCPLRYRKCEQQTILLSDSKMTCCHANNCLLFVQNGVYCAVMGPVLEMLLYSLPWSWLDCSERNNLFEVNHTPVHRNELDFLFFADGLLRCTTILDPRLTTFCLSTALHLFPRCASECSDPLAPPHSHPTLYAFDWPNSSLQPQP